MIKAFTEISFVRFPNGNLGLCLLCLAFINPVPLTWTLACLGKKVTCTPGNELYYQECSAWDLSAALRSEQGNATLGCWHLGNQKQRLLCLESPSCSVPKAGLVLRLDLRLEDEMLADQASIPRDLNNGYTAIRKLSSELQCQSTKSFQRISSIWK